jgi:hypothetical protein
MAAIRKIRLGETVVFSDGASHEAAIVTQVLDDCVNLKVMPPRRLVRDELYVAHRKEASDGTRFWTRIDEDRV